MRSGASISGILKHRYNLIEEEQERERERGRERREIEQESERERERSSKRARECDREKGGEHQNDPHYVFRYSDFIVREIDKVQAQRERERRPRGLMARETKERPIYIYMRWLTSAVCTQEGKVVRLTDTDSVPNLHASEVLTLLLAPLFVALAFYR